MAKKAANKIERKILRYTVKHPISLEVSFEPADGVSAFFMLYGIESEDAEENALLDGDNGKYACWDADVEWSKDYVTCSGADGPSGGRDTSVIIRIPRTLLKEFKISK